jgi:hypothetical protein
VDYRYFGRWRFGALLMLIAAGCSASALVFPWASAGTASVSLVNAGDTAPRLALVFALAAIALAGSVLAKFRWAGWVGVAMGIPVGVASYIAWTGAEAILLAAGAPAAEIQAGLGITFASTAGIASFAGGVAELIVARRDGGAGSDDGDAADGSGDGARDGAADRASDGTGDAGSEVPGE